MLLNPGLVEPYKFETIKKKTEISTEVMLFKRNNLKDYVTKALCSLL